MKTLRVVNLGQAQDPPVSQGWAWWKHHIENTRAYAEKALAKDWPAAADALKELWQAVVDWQEITGCPKAGALMAEHTMLAKLLVDCFVTDAGADCTSTAADAISRNVDEQRSLFPKEADRFADLFGRHSVLAGQYITDLAANDLESFNAHFQEAIESGHDLADFTDEVFFKEAS